jgi:hypothetical protein
LQELLDSKPLKITHSLLRNSVSIISPWHHPSKKGSNEDDHNQLDASTLPTRTVENELTIPVLNSGYSM